MADNVSTPASRLAALEAKIANLLAETVKDLDDIAEKFRRDNYPWRETFKLCREIGQPDYKSEAEFLDEYQANKTDEIRKGIISAVDALVRDMRINEERLEARYTAGEIPVNANLAIVGSLRLGDYYQLPKF